jgi:hypothetical protein
MGEIKHFDTPFEMKEMNAIQMALLQLIEDVELGSQMQNVPFSPEARAEMKDILQSSKSALSKIQQITGDPRNTLPDLEPGEENEYLTKPS